MNNKCPGCGALLQQESKENFGFFKENSNLCERCFRIKHYSEYTPGIKSDEELLSILKKIDISNDLVLIVVDLFNIPRDLEKLVSSIKNDKILVLNKRDLFAKDIYDQKFIEYFDNYFKEIVLVSSKKNTNFDQLYEAINNHKKSKNVYIVGYTNAGKSTLINKLVYNYSDENYEVTTSMIAATTLDLIQVKLNEELILNDTPGLLDYDDIENYIDIKTLKKIIPSNTVRPITYQVKEKQYFVIENLVMIECEKVDINLFISNNLKIKRLYKKPDTYHMKELCLEVNNEDIVISGLGFIKVTGIAKICVYTIDHVGVFTRKHLI